MNKQLYCCNPFKLPDHANVRRTVRPVQDWMLDVKDGVVPGSKVCDKCRKSLGTCRKIYTVESETTNEEKAEPSVEPVVDDVLEEIARQDVIEVLNASFNRFGESPVVSKKMRQQKYPKEKFRKVCDTLKRKVFDLTENESDDNSDTNSQTEIIQQLKERFNNSKDRAEKLTILTILPISWSVRKIEEEFGTTYYTAQRGKQIQNEKGVFSSPNLKKGNALPKQTVEAVIEFFESDEISRLMPGKKDFKSVTVNGEKMHLQKRLILCNLKEAYSAFKNNEKYSHLKVGFSKFSSLRPQHCVLAGASGTHSVCVCEQHQNVKLMVIGANLPTLTKNCENYLVSSYKDCFYKMLCNPPSPSCYYNECEQCPGTDLLIDNLKEMFEKKCIDKISFSQWTNDGDRAKLQCVEMETDEFLETFSEKLTKLLPHSFISENQGNFFKETKENLKEHEFAIICDFAENYKFVVQDEIQRFHWNNSQVTILPFVIYCKIEGKLISTSFVIISDCLDHDAIAVYLYTQRMITFLKSKFPTVGKIYYFSDGAASQFKNRKNFMNLCKHTEDYGISAEWHFFATSHGKGACDGVGGTVKRLATRASLQRPYQNQIMTSRQLFDWCVENIRNIHFNFVTAAEYEIQKELLSERLSLCRSIPGTRKFHAFIPLSTSTTILNVQTFSGSQDSIKVSIIGEKL